MESTVCQKLLEPLQLTPKRALATPLALGQAALHTPLLFPSLLIHKTAIISYWLKSHLTIRCDRQTDRQCVCDCLTVSIVPVVGSSRLDRELLPDD
jgi:hypothetical protein